MLPGTHFIKIDTSELLPFYYFQLQSVLQDSKSLQRFSKDFCPTTGGKKPSLFKLLNFKKRFIVISFAEDRPVGSLVTKKTKHFDNEQFNNFLTQYHHDSEVNIFSQ